MLRFGDIGYRDVCLLSNIVDPGGTSVVELKAPKIKSEKLNSNVSLQKS